MNVSANTQIELTGVVGLDLRQARGNLRPNLPTVLGLPTRTPSVSAESHQPLDFRLLTRAYLNDSYIARAVQRYVSICMQRDPEILAPDRLREYLYRRLQISAVLNGVNLSQWFRLVFRDYVLYGNAFLLKSRTRQLQRVAGVELRPSQLVVAGYFPVPPETMVPVLSEDRTRVIGWRYRAVVSGTRVQRDLQVEDVVHLRYNPLPGSLYGLPFIYSTVSDVRSLRHMEEAVLLLIDKFANPLIHIETPDVTGTGSGIVEDMQVIANAVRLMARDGVLITAPGQKLNVIGAESIALRMEGYLDAFKRRVFSGLGMNSVMIGEESAEQKDVELDRILRDQAIDLQTQFGGQLETTILSELLAEAGVVAPVAVRFHDPDALYWMKMAQASSNLFIANMVTEEEARELVGLEPMTDDGYAHTYVFRAKMPLVEAQHQLRAAVVGQQADASSRLPKHRVADKTRREPIPRKR